MSGQNFPPALAGPALAGGEAEIRILPEQLMEIDPSGMLLGRFILLQGTLDLYERDSQASKLLADLIMRTENKDFLRIISAMPKSQREIILRMSDVSILRKIANAMSSEGEQDELKRLQYKNAELNAELRYLRHKEQRLQEYGFNRVSIAMQSILEDLPESAQIIIVLLICIVFLAFVFFILYQIGVGIFAAFIVVISIMLGYCARLLLRPVL